MAEVSSGKTNESEEFNEDDLDEDEHLFQFTINFGGGNATTASAAASERDQYSSSEDEKNGGLPKKSTRLRKLKATTPAGTIGGAKEVIAHALAPADVTAPIAQEEPLQQQEIVSEVMSYAKVLLMHPAECSPS
jgi:hypothetical protein